jgi:PIN domain nuclease of toxin-antitoxin system
VKVAVIDTHALVWYLSDPKRLGKKARRHLTAVDKGTARLLIPAIVLVELALVREAGRRVLGPVEVEAAIAANGNLEILPLDLAQSKEFVLLGSSRDPFDRMVIAAARVMGVPLLTVDQRIASSGLAHVVWD